MIGSNAKLSALHSDAAHWRSKWDKSLAWALGPPAAVRHFNHDGCLILRRYSGAKHPVPEAPPAIGYAQRPASQVASNGCTSFGTDGIYWHAVERIGKGGVPAATGPQTIKPVVVSGGNHAGSLPNAPTQVRWRHTADGRFRLTWIYNPLGQQAAPIKFEIFHDNGTGTVDLVTPVGDVTAVEGQYHYAWRSSVLSPGDTRIYLVRAKATGNVLSLIPTSGSGGTGLFGNYASAPPAATLPSGAIKPATITAPGAPKF